MSRSSRSKRGLTVLEVLICFVVVALVLGLIRSCRSGDWKESVYGKSETGAIDKVIVVPVPVPESEVDRGTVPDWTPTPAETVSSGKGSVKAGGDSGQGSWSSSDSSQDRGGWSPSVGVGSDSGSWSMGSSSGGDSGGWGSGDSSSSGSDGGGW